MGKGKRNKGQVYSATSPMDSPGKEEKVGVDLSGLGEIGVRAAPSGVSRRKSAVMDRESQGFYDSLQDKDVDEIREIAYNLSVDVKDLREIINNLEQERGEICEALGVGEGYSVERIGKKIKQLLGRIQEGQDQLSELQKAFDQEEFERSSVGAASSANVSRAKLLPSDGSAEKVLQDSPSKKLQLLEEKIKDLEKDRNCLKKKLFDYESVIQDLERQVKSDAELFENLESEIKTAEKEQKITKEIYDEVCAHLQKLSSDNELVKQELKYYKLQLEESKKEAAILLKDRDDFRELSGSKDSLPDEQIGAEEVSIEEELVQVEKLASKMQKSKTPQKLPSSIAAGDHSSVTPKTPVADIASAARAAFISGRSFTAPQLGAAERLAELAERMQDSPAKTWIVEELCKRKSGDRGSTATPLSVASGTRMLSTSIPRFASIPKLDFEEEGVENSQVGASGEKAVAPKTPSKTPSKYNLVAELRKELDKREERERELCKKIEELEAARASSPAPSTSSSADGSEANSAENEDQNVDGKKRLMATIADGGDKKSKDRLTATVEQLKSEKEVLEDLVRKLQNQIEELKAKAEKNLLTSTPAGSKTPSEKSLTESSIAGSGSSTKAEMGDPLSGDSQDSESFKVKSVTRLVNAFREAASSKEESLKSKEVLSSLVEEFEKGQQAERDKETEEWSWGFLVSDYDLDEIWSQLDLEEEDEKQEEEQVSSAAESDEEEAVARQKVASTASQESPDNLLKLFRIAQKRSREQVEAERTFSFNTMEQFRRARKFNKKLIGKSRALQQVIAELTEEKAGLIYDLKREQAASKVTDDIVKGFKLKIAELQEKIEECSKEVEAEKERRLQAYKEAVDIRLQLVATHQQLNTEKDKTAALNTSINDITKKYGAEKKASDEYLELLKALREADLSNKSSIEDLQKKLDQTSQELSKKTEELNEALKKVSEDEDLMQQLATKLESDNTEKGRLKLFLEKEQLLLEKRQEKIDEMNKLIHDREKKIAELESKKKEDDATVDAEKKQLEKEIEEFNSQIKSKAVEIEALNEIINQVKIKLSLFLPELFFIIQGERQEDFANKLESVKDALVGMKGNAEEFSRLFDDDIEKNQFLALQAKLTEIQVKLLANFSKSGAGISEQQFEQNQDFELSQLAEMINAFMNSVRDKYHSDGKQLQGVSVNISDLIDIISAQRKHFELLVRELGLRQGNLDSLKEEMRGKLEGLGKELEQQKAASDQEKAALEQQKADLEQQLAQQKAAKEALEQQLEQQKAAKEASERELEQQKAAKEALERELAQQKAASDQEKAALEQQLGQQKAAKEASERELEQQKAAKEALEQQLEQQKAAKEASERELEQQKAAKEASERELERQKEEKLKKLQTELQKQHESHRSLVDTWQEQLDHKDSKITELKNRNQALENELRQMSEKKLRNQSAEGYDSPDWSQQQESQPGSRRHGADQGSMGGGFLLRSARIDSPTESDTRESSQRSASRVQDGNVPTGIDNHDSFSRLRESSPSPTPLPSPTPHIRSKYSYIILSIRQAADLVFPRDKENKEQKDYNFNATLTAFVTGYNKIEITKQEEDLTRAEVVCFDKVMSFLKTESEEYEVSISDELIQEFVIERLKMINTKRSEIKSQKERNLNFGTWRGASRSLASGFGHESRFSG